MTMKACALIIFIFHSLPASALSSQVQSLVDQCRAVQDAKIDPSLSPREVTGVLKKVVQEREAVCGAAQDALDEQQRVTEQSLQAVGKVPETMHATLEAVDTSVSKELTGFQNIIADARAVTDIPSDANNAELLRITQKAALSQNTLQELTTNWNSLFFPGKDGPIDVLYSSRDNPTLPPEMQTAIDDFFSHIPPYFLGKGPAPQEKLDFLKAQAGLVRRALKIKDREYGRSLVNDVSKVLDEDLERPGSKLTAATIRANVLNSFSYRTTNWAARAAAGGACFLAQDDLAQQIAVLKSVPFRVGEAARADLAIALQPDIQEREAFAATLSSCDSSKLKASLEAWQHQLPLFCRTAPYDLQISAREAVNDVNLYIDKLSRVSNPEDKSALNVIGGEIWDKGYGVANQCGRASK